MASSSSSSSSDASWRWADGGGRALEQKCGRIRAMSWACSRRLAAGARGVHGLHGCLHVAKQRAREMGSIVGCSMRGAAAAAAESGHVGQSSVAMGVRGRGWACMTPVNQAEARCQCQCQCQHAGEKLSWGASSAEMEADAGKGGGEGEGEGEARHCGWTCHAEQEQRSSSSSNRARNE